MEKYKYDIGWYISQEPRLDEVGFLDDVAVMYRRRHE